MKDGARIVALYCDLTEEMHTNRKVCENFRGGKAKEQRFVNAIRILFFAYLFYTACVSYCAASEFYGISKPSAEVSLGFTLPGRVAAVNVSDGARVRGKIGGHHTSFVHATR